MDISVVIVSWNCADFLVPCLRSLEKGMAGVEYETFVVDNNSSDDSAGLVRRDFPGVKLIANADNRGFAAANNQAVALASGRYILFLNPDTEICDGAMLKWLEFMDCAPDCSVSGCRLLNTDGTHQPSVRTFPGFGMAFMRYTPLRLVLGSLSKRRYRPTAVDYPEPLGVEQVSGAAIFVRRADFPGNEIFDERFFIFFEEVDLCLRARKSGRRVVYYPMAQIVHHGGKSRRHMKIEINAIQLRSMLAFFRKHEPSAKFFFMNLLFKPLFVIQLFLDIVFGYPEHLIRRLTKPASDRADSFEKKTAFVRRHLADFIFRY